MSELVCGPVWGDWLAKLINVGMPSRLWVAPFPRQCKNGETKLSTSRQTSKQAWVFICSLLWTVGVTARLFQAPAAVIFL